MAGDKKKKDRKTSLKKELFLQVFNQLSSNMEWLKVHVGEKKWGNRIKKVSKLLSQGVKEKKSKPVKATKTKTVKKDASNSIPTPAAEQLT